MDDPNRNQPITVWVPENMTVKNYVTIATGMSKDDKEHMYFSVFKSGVSAWERVGMLEAALTEAKNHLYRVMKESRGG